MKNDAGKVMQCEAKDQSQWMGEKRKQKENLGRHEGHEGNLKAAAEYGNS